MRDEMRIEKITLYNYRQYYDKVEVKFTTKDNAFSIVVGANGAGKSNLWNAIHWCLFNKEPHLKSADKPPIINKKYLDENSDGLITTYVEIIMVKGRTKYLIKRKLVGQLDHLKKDENGMIILSKEDPVPAGFFIQNLDSSKLFQISENGGKWETKNNPRTSFENLVHEHIIPENLSKFFILDGEFLQDLFNEFENIKSGIDQISQINVLNKTIEEIRDIKFNYPKGTGKLSEIQKNIDRHRRILASEDKLGKKLCSETRMVYGTDDPMHQSGEPYKDDLNRSIINMDKELRDLSRMIADSDARNKLDIKNSHAETLQKKKLAESELETMIRTHIDHLVVNGPLIMCKPSLESATTLIKSEMTKGNLPNTYKRLMVGDLLAKNKCLCGTSLGHGTDARKHVEFEMKQIADQVQYDIASDMRYYNELFLKGYDETLQQLDSESKSIMEKEKSLMVLDGELKYLKRRLAIDDADYADLINQHDSLIAQRDEYQRELGAADTDIKRHKAERADEIRKLNVANEHIRKNKEAILIIQKDMLVRKALDKIKEDIDKAIRDKVAYETLKIYNSMSWKKNYNYLQIDDRYQISIMGEEGMNIVGGMAAGEKLFLALSFIMALKKITKYRFPFVIDSPLGKAGGNLKISFGKHMPKLLDGSQMIMLATNTEYSENKIQPESGLQATHTLKELLEQNGTVHEYKIDFNKAAETADIIQGSGSRHV